MGYSICIFCGESKKKPLQKCRSCGRSPVGCDDDVAKSLIASEDLIDEEGDPLKSRAELLEISEKIKLKEYFFDQDHVDLLLQQKKILDDSPGIEWGFLFFGFCFLIIPITAILVFFFGK